MNELIEKENIKIENYIYEIRGKQVMLASDVAKLYQVETRFINQVVKRNINRFPESFCFQLTEDEYNTICSRSQFVILNSNGNKRGSNLKYLPYVFSEHGIIMLSGLLKSDIAAQVNIKIIEAFVEMRKLIGGSKFEFRLSNVEQKLLTYDHKFKEYDNQFEELFSKFRQEESTHLFFDGQIYDAYSLLLDIFNTAKEEIIIIDNFIDKKMFDLFSKLNISVIVYSENIAEELYKKYKRQYQNVDIKINTKYDRFIIIDRKYLYHSGASFKDLGKKCFALTKIESEDILNQLLEKLSC